MDANDFWAMQIQRNTTSEPKYKISTDANTPEEEWMSEWIEKWRNQFAYFNNSGCGCCVNFYEFDAPEDAISEIPPELLDAM